MSPGEFTNNVDFGDKDNTLYSFSPKLSDYKPSDMSIQPGTNIDKVRTDFYLQSHNEFKIIRGMIAKLLGGELGGDQSGEHCHIVS